MNFKPPFSPATEVEEAFARAKRKAVEPENPFLCVAGGWGVGGCGYIYPEAIAFSEKNIEMAKQYRHGIKSESDTKMVENLQGTYPSQYKALYARTAYKRCPF